MKIKRHYNWAKKHARKTILGAFCAGFILISSIIAYGDHINVQPFYPLISGGLPQCKTYATGTDPSGNPSSEPPCGCTACAPPPIGCNCVPNASIACSAQDCADATSIVARYHNHYRQHIIDHIKDEGDKHKEWWTDVMVAAITNAMQKFADQLTAVSMHQVFAIGTFFDAKHQMESQLLFQKLQVTAYEDYQPSEGVCTLGTAVRSMAHTDSASKAATLSLNTRQMARHLGNKNIGGAKDSTSDKKNRWHQFTENYCDPQDNEWISVNADSGLTSVCTAPQIGRSDKTNIDVDFTRMIENRRILDIDPETWAALGDEPDIMALGNNLYGHNVLSRNIGELAAKNANMEQIYMGLRSVAAKRNVAETTFNNLIGMRATGTGMNAANANGTEGSGYFIGRMLMDLGIPESEVTKYLGLDATGAYKQPSYLATLEILTKKVFQDPNFYANLYDTPANVKRKAAALKAFDLMLDRAIYESQLRREMAMSVLLSSRVESFKYSHPSSLWKAQ